MERIDEDQWEMIAEVDDIPEGEPYQWMIGDDEVALYRVDGEIYATDNWCTHADARLSNGCLKGHEVECPLHSGRFDIRTGKALCEPLTEDVKTYPVRVLDGCVYAKKA